MLNLEEEPATILGPSILVSSEDRRRRQKTFLNCSLLPTFQLFLLFLKSFNKLNPSSPPPPSLLLLLLLLHQSPSPSSLRRRRKSVNYPSRSPKRMKRTKTWRISQTSIPMLQERLPLLVNPPLARSKRASRPRRRRQSKRRPPSRLSLRPLSTRRVVGVHFLLYRNGPTNLIQRRTRS